MLVYTAAYVYGEDGYLAEVLDFPGAVSFGKTLNQARRNLASALEDLAETNLLAGQPLPLSNPDQHDERAEIEEPIYLSFGPETGAVSA
jgi:predicted RNase H-like HicB family nuclease